MIAFIGSVFSPYYAWAGRRDPLDHCAINVALYGAAGRHWAMTERGRAAVRRDRDRLEIGPSSLTWEDGGLTVRFRERTAPTFRPIAGTIRLHPRALNTRAFGLDAEGRHTWRPVAPRAAAEVSLASPRSAWRGQAYLDTNAGDEPLEDRFVAWDWSRAHLPDDETRLFYDVTRRDGAATSLALRVDAAGGITPAPAPAASSLPPTFWRMPRRVRAEGRPRLVEALEDAPFYTRSLLEGRLDDAQAVIVHESLSLDRLRAPIVRAMLPFRMPRVLV